MFLPYRFLAISLKRTQCWKPYLDYERSLMKRENCKCRIQFIENCRSTDVIPKFLKFRIPNNGCSEPTAVHNFQRKLLKQELFKAKKALAEHELKVKERKDILKGFLPRKLLPSVLLFTSVTVFSTRKNVEAAHTKKLENLSKGQGRQLFNLHDTVKLFELNVLPPKYVLKTFVLGPKNPVLEKFNQKVMLAEIDLLLNRLQEQNVSNDVINDINVATINYIKKCSKESIPKNLIMTEKYLKEHDLLAVPFDEGIGVCLMKCQSYENKLMDILKLKQFKKMEKARKNAKEFCIKEEERINSVLEELNERGKIDK